MTAAAVRATNTTASTNSTSVAVNMPASIVNGELLLVIGTVDNPGATAITAGSDWFRIVNNTQGSNVLRFVVFAKIAGGGDTCTISGLNQDSAVVSLAVNAHGVYNVVAEIFLVTVATADTGNADPPNCAPGSTKDWLYIASCGIDMTNAGDTLSAQPSGYTDHQRLKSASSTSSCATGVASLQTTASSSNNPGTFTNTSRPWIAHTMAIPPFAAPTPAIAATMAPRLP